MEEADAGEMQNPEERQPDPVQAEQAVNPELQGAGRGREKRKPVAEDRPKR